MFGGSTNPSIMLRHRIFYSVPEPHLKPISSIYFSDLLTLSLTHHMSGSVATRGLELVVVFAFIYVLKTYLAKPKLPHGVRLPPGPPGMPLIGNALAVDVSAPWITYKTWGSQYGKLVYIRLFGQENVVINSEEIARDLLEHRSQNYSDRPVIATNDLLSVDFNTAFMQYNSRWRLQRKFLQQSFRQDAVPKFRPMQIEKTHELLMNLLEDPLDYPKHFHSLAGSVIMSALYSYNAERRDDLMIKRACMAADIITRELRPEVAAVFSIFPFLLRLPSWLPGMRLKRIAPLAKELSVYVLETPFLYTEHGLAAGSILSSGLITDNLLKLDENDSEFEWKKKALRESASTAFGAGVDTTAAVLMNFVLAMILYPRVQEKAFALLESVVGTSRLPTFQDRPSLLYIDAIMRECLRWRPVLPIAIPHAAVDSDVYEKYYIPKGAVITANVWAMCHDEQKYPKASEFKPERFLNSDGTLTSDTVNAVWGFGRRICPGRHLAEVSLWSSMACLLAMFRFSKARDDNGGVIDFDPRWRGGLVVHPEPFPCHITPRNEKMDMAALQHLIKVSA